MIPDKIGRYQVEDELGRGGMATVYRARDPIAERDVAIKVLPPEMMHDPQFKVRFEREAKVIARLEHPAIVPVYDFGEDQGLPYFVMRYMTGGSLSDRLKDGPLTIAEASHLFARLAPALDSAHAKGIIHRDLKPGNILFDEYGEPYISDFGIAKITESASGMTGSGIVGTPAYMSPEQAQGGEVDSRSDIYGLGVILFEALTGHQPYSGDTPMSVVVKHITDPVPHILDVRSDLPLGIEKIIGKALAKDKNERFATCQALADALGSVSRGETLIIGSAPTESRMAARTTRVSKKPSDEARTITGVMEPVKVPQQPRKHPLVWVGILVGMFVIFAMAAGALFLFRDRIPFLAGLAPTMETPLVTSSTEPAVVTGITPTDEPLVVVLDTPTATSTDTPSPSPEPTLPALGGSDLIAFLNGNNIWLVGVDGSDPRQLTTDGTIKHSLQWTPDGKSLLYIVGKCIKLVDIEAPILQDITCFPSAEFLDDLSVSPEGNQIAITLDRVLYVVPYDLAALATAHNHTSLADLPDAFTYNKAGVKSSVWSGTEDKIAMMLNAPIGGGKVADVIRVLDIPAFLSTAFGTLADFPSAGSTAMTGYGTNNTIPAYDWDGDSLFLLSTRFRNEVYGYLYTYNTESRRYSQLDPLKTGCCYSDAAWSADGTYIFFSYQDLSLGSASINELYFIEFGSIAGGGAYTPILPPGFLVNVREHPEAALRPAR
jgi:tRNA A-37 threonylcarbamoyl transferase component Bud32